VQKQPRNAGQSLAGTFLRGSGLIDNCYRVPFSQHTRSDRTGHSCAYHQDISIYYLRIHKRYLPQP
jgi:hypothetical protein